MGMCHSAQAKDVTSHSALPDDAAVVFVLGGPGSGKGTQCEKIAAKYNCAHISAGDLLREEVSRGTNLGKECDALMKEGKLVPIEITLTLLQNAMLKSEKKTFLIDGFPRAIDQATRFDAEIKPCTTVLFFDCSEEVMMQRLVERGKTSGRADDNAETIQKRLKTFTDMSAPVAKFYETQGKCYRVSAEDVPEVVFDNVQKVLDEYLKANIPTDLKQETEAAPEMKIVEEKKPADEQPTKPIEAIDEAPNAEVIDEAPKTEAVDATPKAEIEEASTEFENDPTETRKTEEVEETEKEEILEKKLGRVVFVLGGPGSGKGTQCERIVRDYGYRHISVGDLLRDEVASGSELGQECDALMKEGKLVPIKATLGLLKKAIVSGSFECYLIDGFPRSIEQAALFEQEVASCDCVLHFDCSEDVMLKRMTERSKQSGRADDNPETMQKRLETFKEVSAPVARFYSEQGKCHTIPAEREPFEIYADVQKILDALQKASRASEVIEAVVAPTEPAATSEESTVVILESSESQTATALCVSLKEKGVTSMCKGFEDGVDLTKLKAKVIVWNPSTENAESLQEQLVRAVEEGAVILPSLEMDAAIKDAEFAKKITEKSESEGAEKVSVQLAFETPIGVVANSGEAEKAEGGDVHLKPDDPEVTPLIQQLVSEDLEKIKAVVGSLLPALWSAVYEIQGDGDSKDYVFSGLKCLPLDLTDRLEYVDAIATTIAGTLPA